ncbi:bifunctional DedA family/phosphatase PAP2 family protein [Sansalvadorimonas verongulae]|uniref:bifunctional DedA family/phosphatase PAP2 family protein n=1 Tax=Sansalvadorimonas verongulae TaxID=2172824 RepID=UPI0012BB63CC|nr:bifunctional DedA family/phosphatase PAP2 family protein [Sansalvadorimonas verongulae]MTI14693.1 phosphatase PAP2 family protein [Sansalvadorimonas verongulae]
MIELSSMAQWVQQQQDWIAFIIMAVAFMESLAVVGLILPGVVMLFTAASLVGGGALDVWTMLLAGFAGAVLGDGVSFIAGQIFHKRIRGWWPFHNHPQWLEQGERFFKRHGGISIALGRFVGPIRPVIPVVAGMMGMPSRYFYLVNILSAALWAPAYLLPGYLVGASVYWQDHFPFEIAAILIALAILAVTLVYGFTALQKRVKSYRCALLTVILAFGGLFALIAIGNFTSGATLINNSVQTWIQARHTGLLDQLFFVITQLGEFWLLLPIVLLGGYWLFRDSGWKPAAGFLMVGLGLEAAIKGMKIFFACVRPETATSASFSFPSGHTTYAMFMGMWVCWYLARYLSSKYQPCIWALGLFTAFATAVSRLYLGAHWTFDVLSGAALGSLSFFIWLLIEHSFPTAIDPRNLYWRVGQLVVAILAIVIS